MIYIVIDHINGEIQEIYPKYFTNYDLVKEYLLAGYLVVSIDINNNFVKEIH